MATIAGTETAAGDSTVTTAPDTQVRTATSTRAQQDADAHLSARIINYVQQNYTGSLTLEQMARDLGYNYTYLSAYFNQRLHTGFQDFVNQYRVSHAAMLLQGSSIPVTQVAEQCGFGTIRSFNRVFLKSLGMSPTAFRKQNR